MSTEMLAALGGLPEFAEPLHVGKPNIPNRKGFEQRLSQVLDSGWLTNDGPLVRELEAQIIAYLKVDHCIAVANATIGLELVMRALDLTGEVILPSFTFVATAHAVTLAGLTPVFCDIDPSTHNLDPKIVEDLISERTAAILGVHVWGRPCAVDKLEALSLGSGVPLLFDAAHALGCSHRRRMIGTFGRAEVFSLHATKFLHSFEGGLITTADPDLAQRLRLARNFGFEGYDRVAALGTNAKMSEVHAAMALSNLEVVDQLLSHNSANLSTYLGDLCGSNGLCLLDTRFAGAGNAQYVIAEIDPSVADRDQVVSALHQENVLARRYFFPGAHRSAPYCESRHRPLPATEDLSARALALPNGLAVTPEDVGRVCQLLRKILAPA